MSMGLMHFSKVLLKVFYFFIFFKKIKQTSDPFANLQSIDLSFNELTKISPSLTKYPNIRSLYLHGNSIENFNEVKKLKSMANLRRLTLHGNPLGMF